MMGLPKRPSSHYGCCAMAQAKSKKMEVERDERGRVVKGTPNPRGKQKGTLNKTTVEVKTAITAALFVQLLKHITPPGTQQIEVNVTHRELIQVISEGRKRVAEMKDITPKEVTDGR